MLGCSSERDATNKRLAELGEDIRKLQSSHDSVLGRLDSLELKTARDVPQNAPRAQRVERPELKVVKVVPQGDPVTGAVAFDSEITPEERPDAPGPRPVIRLRGGGREGRAGPERDAGARESEENP